MGEENLLIANHEVISETLFPCDVLPLLLELTTVTADQRDVICSHKTRREQCHELIDVVRRGGPSAPGEFLASLKKSYKHLHDHICKVEHSANFLMTDDHKSELIKKRTEYVQKLDVEKAISGMINNGHMSESMKDDILSHRTNQARVESFLDRLATREDQAYHYFVADYQHLTLGEELTSQWDDYIDTLRTRLGERIEEGVKSDSNVYSGLQLKSIFTPLTLQLEPKDEFHERWLDFEDADGPDSPQIEAQCMFEGREEWRDHPDPHCVLVKGPAGIGKTTMLLNLILSWKDRRIWSEDFDAVYLFQFRRLNYLLQQRMSVIDLLTRYHPPAGLDKDKAKKLLLDERKKILICFDGLDEFRGFDGIHVEDYPDITGDTETELSCLLYNIFKMNILSNARIIVTSRPTAATHLPVFHRTVEIQGFSEPQRLDYVARVCEAKAGREEGKFKKAFADYLKLNPQNNRLSEAQFVTRQIHQYLKDHPNVFSLLYLPLLASFMCELLPRIILGKEHITVETTTQVYVQCFLLFARSRSRSEDLKKKKPRHKYEILTKGQDNEIFHRLCSLAKWGVMSNPAKYVFYESELDKADLVINTKDDLSLGFLKYGMSQGDDLFDVQDTALEFLHLTMQEFFAAVEFLLTWPEKEISEMILCPTGGKYDMVLLFMAGLLGDPACFEFVSSLLSPEKEARDELVAQRETRLLWLFTRMNQSFEGNRFSKREEKMARKRMLLLLFESQKKELVDTFKKGIVGNGELVLDSVKLSPSDLQAIDYFLTQQDRLTSNGHNPVRHEHDTPAVRIIRLWRFTFAITSNVKPRTSADYRFLTTLTLDRSGIGPEGTRLLKPFLQSSLCKVEVLNLRESSIGEDGAFHLGEILEKNKSLKHLFLTENKLSDRGIERIAGGLWGHPSLQKISLRQNGIGPDGAYHLANMLRHNKSLQILYLSYNSIGDEGIAHIMKCFIDGKNSTLVEIHLRCNSIGDEGAKHIACYIETDGRRDMDLGPEKQSSLQFIRKTQKHT